MEGEENTMGITLDEVITRVEEAVEENQRVVDTGIVFNDVTIDMLYCDDTEVIEEHLANYQKCAKEQRQLAEWLKDYKRLKELEPCEDVIRREDAINAVSEALEHVVVENEDVARKMINKLPSVKPQQPCADAVSRQAVLDMLEDINAETN